ncbi:c-type cytochrome [Methylobrevis pamukkalensis]|uniref:Cytochrome c-554 n=1 Tax=Methylobrevis pamukkalensis TaxID=1439726 RepID=A0A1E3GX39_9HYPH|nr:c-type cytochrome [Methylobrevis pamukkalensis]ODN68583.1 Cytochrome c-554 precursor [Methylobrevis pamukkalensis]
MTRTAHAAVARPTARPMASKGRLAPFALAPLALAALLAMAPQPARAQADGGGEAGGDGQVNFNNSCRTCHTTSEGDNRLGPNLAGIIGRKAGSAEGYSYSSALAQADVTWDEATLDRFLENPDAWCPATT